MKKIEVRKLSKYVPLTARQFRERFFERFYDPAFDAVDLILWKAEELETIEARAERLAAATGMDAERLVGWSAAFAACSGGRCPIQ